MSSKSGTHFGLPTVSGHWGHESIHDNVPGEVAGRAWRDFEKRQSAKVLPYTHEFYRGAAGTKAKQLVAELFRVDFEQYGYDKKQLDAASLGDVRLDVLHLERHREIHEEHAPRS